MTIKGIFKEVVLCYNVLVDIAEVTQLVECFPEEEKVGGSSPPLGTSIKKPLNSGFLIFKISFLSFYSQFGLFMFVYFWQGDNQ